MQIPPPAPEKIKAPKPRRVLIVEDNHAAAETMQVLLELAGHAVRVAHDGLTALAQAQSFLPEIIFCDIGLPGNLDGYIVARAIRRMPKLKDAYLVALSGFGQAEDKNRAKRCGFNLHLTKPVDLDVLNGMMGNMPTPA